VHAADGAVLQAVAARDASRALRLGPRGRAYADYAALLEDPEVDAVYVALHNDAHLPWTLAALQAGKHVLCEKPLGLSAAEVATMAEAAQSADRLLVEATWSRWHPRTRRAEALLRTQAVGEVRLVEAGFTFPSVPEGNYRLDADRGGGALYDVGPYALGAPLWVLPGVEPVLESVTVLRTETGVDATTSVVLQMGAARAEVVTSIARDPAQWLRVEGDLGVLTLTGPAFTSCLAPSTLLLDSVDGSGRQLDFAPVDPYQLMVEHVSRAVRGDATAWVLPLEESARVARAVDLVRGAAG
jgi:predicted dehydrogenase